MKIGHGTFARFAFALLRHDKDAVIPTRKKFKARVDRAAKRRNNSTNITQTRTFGTCRPLRPL